MPVCMPSFLPSDQSEATLGQGVPWQDGILAATCGDRLGIWDFVERDKRKLCGNTEKRMTIEARTSTWESWIIFWQTIIQTKRKNIKGR